MSRASNEQDCGDKFADSSNLRKESSISTRSGVQKTTKSFEKGMRMGGMGSAKRCADFLGGIPAGSLTRFGAGQPGSDLFGRPQKNLASALDNLGPKMTTESFSPWQVTKPRHSSPKPYIDLKMPSVI